MAERNVLYQRNPRSLNIPTLDYANARAIAQGSAQLNQSLNRLTNFISQKNANVAKTKGTEYGAANAPTIDQINDALKTGKELEFPGSKTGSLFDRAVNAAAMEVFSDNLETAARSQITQKAVMAEQNNMPIAEMRNSLDAIIQGYADSFGEVDAGFAQRFKARMGIVANSQYQSYAGKYKTRIDRENKASFISAFQIAIDEELPKIIANGIDIEFVDGQVGEAKKRTNIAATTEIIQGMKADLAQKMVKRGFGPSEVTQFLNVFDKKVDDYAYDVIESHVLGAKNIIEANILVENLLAQSMPTNVKVAFDLLGPEKINEANELAKNALDLFQEQQTDIMQLRENRIKTNTSFFKQEIGTALIEMSNDFEGGKLSVAMVLDKYENLIPLEIAEFKEKYNMTTVGAIAMPGSSKQDVRNAFTQDLAFATQRYSIQDVMDEQLRGNLSQVDYESFLTGYSIREDKNFKKALNFGRSMFGLNESMIVLNPQGDNAVRINKMNAFERALILERDSQIAENNLAFDAFEWTKNNINRFVGESEDEILAINQARINNMIWTKAQLEAVSNDIINQKPLEVGSNVLSYEDAVELLEILNNPKIVSDKK